MIFAAILALVSVVLAQNNLVTFDRDCVVTSDVMFHSEPVGVRLNKQPKGNVTVYLASAGTSIRSNKCALTFTPANWNSSQQLVLNTAAPLVANSNNNVSVILDAPSDADLHKKEQFLGVRHELKDRKSCVSAGDPHYSTFDGKAYSSMTEGLLTMVRSDRLTIQALQFKCHRDLQISCNAEVSIRYMNTFVYWKVSREFNQSTVSGLTIEQFGSTNEIRQTKLGDNYFRFSTSDGSDIELATGFWPVGMYWYTNIVVYLGSSYKGRVSGMCGNNNDNPNDDWDPLKTFNENAVPDATDYRFCKSKCPPAPWSDTLLGSVCTAPIINNIPSSTAAPSSTIMPSSMTAAPTSTLVKASSTVAPSSSSTPSSSPNRASSSQAPLITSTSSVPAYAVSSNSASVSAKPTMAAPVVSSSAAPKTSPSVGGSMKPTSVAGSSLSMPAYPSRSSVPSQIIVSTSAPAYAVPSSKIETVFPTSAEVGHLTVRTSSTSSVLAPTKTACQELVLPTSLPDTPDTAYGQAKKVCSNVFAQFKCSNVDVTFMLQGCILDATAQGSIEGVVEGYMKMAVSACNNHLQTLKQSDKPEHRIEAHKLVEMYNLAPDSDERDEVEPTKKTDNQKENASVSGEIEDVKSVSKKNASVSGETENVMSESKEDATVAGETEDIKSEVAQVKKEATKTSVCKNGGTPAGYGGCKCPKGFTGFDCTIDVSDCKTIEPTKDELQAVTGFGGNNSSGASVVASSHSVAMIIMLLATLAF